MQKKQTWVLQYNWKGRKQKQENRKHKESEIQETDDSESTPRSQEKESRASITEHQTSSGQINILQWNAQSLYNKMDEFKLLLSEHNIDVACILLLEKLSGPAMACWA